MTALFEEVQQCPKCEFNLLALKSDYLKSGESPRLRCENCGYVGRRQSDGSLVADSSGWE